MKGHLVLRPLLIRIAAAVSLAVLSVTTSVASTKIQRIVTPSGIEAWLVHEPSVPLVALNFAFRGGANQDPVDKPGVANMISTLLDEGAGDVDAKTYHERREQGDRTRIRSGPRLFQRLRAHADREHRRSRRSAAAGDHIGAFRRRSRRAHARSAFG